jgi:hypothetical protein
MTMVFPPFFLLFLSVPGILIVKGNSCILKNMEGKELSKSTAYGKKSLKDLSNGSTLTIGGNELEVTRITHYW